MRIELPLTAEQAAQIEPFVAPGRVLLGRVLREGYDGEVGNGETCGRLILELGTVPESILPRLRAAIAKATGSLSRQPPPREDDRHE